MEQRRNDRLVARADFANIVTQRKDLPESAIRDMFIAWITLKFTQSNSVCFVADGQTIGVGAGQQSRIHCVRLAGQKADLWQLRQHPHVLGLPFRPEIKRAERDNALPYMKPARRPIAIPASTFSLVASSMNPRGATIGTPARAESATTASIPAK